MKIKPIALGVCICLLLATDAAAQYARTVTNWTIETPYGLVGYRSTDFGGGPYLLHRAMYLGPFGSVTVTMNEISVGVVVISALLTAAIGISTIRRRRSRLNTAQADAVDVIPAIHGKSMG